jgi:hypothetical protein
MANIIVDVLMDFGGGLVSVIADVLSAGDLHANWGNTACDPQTRVADTGQFTFTLNNSQCNSNKTIGYYSPGNASARSGFTAKTPVVLKMTYGGTTKYKRFYIATIDPVPGTRGARQTAITAYDIMDYFATQPATNLAVQVNQRPDQGLATVLALLPVAPLAKNLQASPDTCPYLFDDITPTTMLITALQHLAMTDAGYIFPAGDSTVGETMSYHTRWYRQTQASGLTISADMNTAHVLTDEKNVLNDIIVSAFPAAVGTGPETLYQVSNEIVVNPGNPIAMQCNYSDPTSGKGSSNKVRVVPGSGIAPVAGTDWKASFTSGGEAVQDANASLSIAVTWYASYALVVFTDNASKTIFINPFVLRGTIMRLYNQIDVRVMDTAPNIAKYGDNVLQYSMYYQSSQSVANDMANHWLSMWHLPIPVSEYHEYYANRNATTAAAAVTLDIGNRYTATESVTGINQDYNIMGIDITIQAAANGYPTVLMRYYPEPANSTPSFILDDAVYGVLDTGIGVLAF